MKKQFKLEYTPFDVDGYQFHIDISAPLTQKQGSTIAMIPGVNKMKQTNYHLCIQKAELFACPMVDMLYSFEVFMEQIGYENVGLSAENLVKYQDALDSDANERILADFSLAKNLPIFEHPKKNIGELKRDLEDAISVEDYEFAAQLRDQISELEKS